MRQWVTEWGLERNPRKVAAAPFLVVVLLVAGDRTIMGRSRNHVVSSVIGWLTAVAMAVFGVLAIWSQIAGS